MDITELMIRLLGIYFLVAGIALFTNRDLFAGMVREFTKKTTGAGFRGIIGVLNLIIGLLIVLNHNLWVDFPTVIVSLVGWIALLKGAAYLILPNITAKVLEMWGERYALAGIISLVIGAYLTFVGFFSASMF